jgi:hypothetical protein
MSEAGEIGMAHPRNHLFFSYTVCEILPQRQRMITKNCFEIFDCLRILL